MADGRSEAERTAIVDAGCALLTLLGGNQHDTIGGTGTVDSCRSILQHGYALNLRSVEIVESLSTEVLRHVAYLHVVRIDIAVDDVQRLLSGRTNLTEGADITDTHRGALSGAAVTATDAQTVHQSAQRRGQTGIGQVLHIVHVDRGDGARQVSFLLCAVTHYDHFLQRLLVFFQLNSAAGLHRLRQVADVTDDHSAVLRCLNRIVTIKVGDGCRFCSLHGHCSSDDGFAVFIDHSSRHRLVLSKCGHGKERQQQAQTYTEYKFSFHIS